MGIEAFGLRPSHPLCYAMLCYNNKQRRRRRHGIRPFLELLRAAWRLPIPSHAHLAVGAEAAGARSAGRKCQTPLHGHRLRACCTTPTDKLTTIIQLVVQQICHTATSEPKISTCQDVWMWQIFVRWWWICCTASCRIVVSSSVGGVVQHVRSRCPCNGVWALRRTFWRHVTL